MNSKIVFVFAALFLIAICSKQKETNAQSPAKEWKLVWSDEFDYTGLPNPEKWGYEEGFVRNQEAQYYTKERLENVFVKDGVLTIRCIKEEYPIKQSPRSNNQTIAKYTSGSINTRGKGEWTFGKIEVKAKLPSGKGVWPAIWTLGSNVREIGWPRCGEVDIMEFVGNEPDKIHANVHYYSAEKESRVQHQGNITAQNTDKAFHVYTLEWDANTMIFKFDGVQYHSVDISNVGDAFTKPHYLLLNFALGGAWGGEIDDSILPQDYQVDYVRVYQLQ